jgi:RNA polymerase sigma factor (sigma-70 family)
MSDNNVANSTVDNPMNVLPPPDSPDFWHAINALTAIKGRELEEIAAAVRFFALNNRPDDAQRAFTELYRLYQKTADKLARKFSRHENLREELTQRVWTDVHQRLISFDQNRAKGLLRDFVFKFDSILRSLAEQQGNEEGYGDQKSRVPSKITDLMSKPLNTGEDGSLTVQDTIEDGWGEYTYEFIERHIALKQRLTQQELQIMSMRLRELSKEDIAKELHIAAKTVSRILEEIKPKVKEILAR